MKLGNYTFIGLPLLFFAIFFNCSAAGEIKITKDEFKNGYIAELEQDSLGDEEDKGHIITLIYSREFFDPKVQPPTIIRFIVSAPERSYDLEPNGFLKIGEKTFNIKFEGLYAGLKSQTYQSTGTDPATGKQVSYSGVTVNKQLKGVLQLTKEQEALISESKSITLRMYSGSSPFTFIIKEERLEKIKEFLKTNPPEETQPASRVVPETKDRKKSR